MPFDAVLPALIVVVVASGAGAVRWPLRPAIAVRMLTAIAVMSAGTVFFLAVVGVVALFGRSTMDLAFLDWCPLVPFHHEISGRQGALAVVVMAVAVWRMKRVLARRRWAIEGTEGRRMAVLDTCEPIAFAAPGTPGCVVVSSGMLEALDPDERRVLFAHERAHLDQRHDRYLLLTELAVAVVPTLRPLATQLRTATERCADEAAVAAVGDDRRLVARSVARAAVSAQRYHDVVGGFGGGSVVHRVHALTAPAPPSMMLNSATIGTLALAAIVVGAGGLQVHHVAEVIEHLCH